MRKPSLAQIDPTLVNELLARIRSLEETVVDLKTNTYTKEQVDALIKQAVSKQAGVIS